MKRSASTSILNAVQQWSTPGCPGVGLLRLVRANTWVQYESTDALRNDFGSKPSEKLNDGRNPVSGSESLMKVLDEGVVGRYLLQRMPSFASSQYEMRRSFTSNTPSPISTGKRRNGKNKKNTSVEESNHDGQQNAALLQSIRAIDFLPHLEALKASRKVMTYDELVLEFHLALPLASEEDAVAICESLTKSGAIIKMGDVIYLHPQEIAQTLRTVLPIDAPMLRKRLEVVNHLLEPMEEIKSLIESKGMRRNKIITCSFLGIMAAQWGIFFRLCYWDLSWDVVEPIGFFSSGLTTILSFAWFMQTRKNFSFEGLSHRVTSSYVQKKLEEENFNFVEYARLKQEKQRLEESLASIHSRIK